MSKLSHASSRRMYSWWWDSHISPQNSRWLVENLTDMDAKVNSMIKLIEHDADSFASRAEMYYEKRPELLKLVEEFYRAYRALAERYDHATGALRQATEAFPNQVPSEIIEEELEICSNQNDKDNFGELRVERGFDINGAEDNKQNTLSAMKLEKGNQTLSEVLAEFEAEKESSLAQYKHCLEKLTHQEIDFLNAQEGSKRLAERANKAEDEVECLRKSLKALELEKENSLLECKKYLENIKNMEEIISSAQKDVFDLKEKALKAETEAQALKINLEAVELEKATSLDQYKQSIEKILDLENKLIISENEAKVLNKRVQEGETEAETLKRQCLDSISSLETKLTCSQEEVQMLNEEVEKGIYKLKGAEEQYLDLERSNQYLQTELQTLKLEVGAQSEELVEKKREINLLSTRVEEENLRSVEAKTAFQMLQLLQAQTEKELNALSLELEKRSLIIIHLETRNQSLVNEALKITEENKRLSELNLASSLSMKDMQSEILSLKEAKEKLEKEFELGVDQKNTLQEEIVSVKEELNDLNKNYHNMVVQVDAVGFKPECFQSAVKDLQDENLNLKETQEKESREKEDLLKKLEDLKNVNEKNALLEKSVSDLNADLEGARDEIIAMVKSIQSLFEEKNTIESEKVSLVTQLQFANKHFEKLSEKYAAIEMAVSDANNAIEALKMKLEGIEKEKSDLINEKVTLVSQLEITGERLEGIEKKLHELEEKHSVLKKEKESTESETDELQLINKESKLKEDKHMIEIENLHGMVLDTQKTSVTLREDNLKLIDEKISLVKDLLDLQDKNSTVEGENLSILSETASLSNLSLILKNIVSEKALEIETLEEKTNAKDKVIKLLEEKIKTLEVKNGEIEDRLAGYLPAISSLKECITSLEICTSPNNEKVKAGIQSDVEDHEGSNVDQKETDKLSELKELEERVKNVEKKVLETNSKLEVATVQIEENTKPSSVNSESLDGLLAKDIMLDQISNMNGEDNVTTPTKKVVHFNSIIEKELGLDKIAAANRFALPNEELDKTMILERVNSDSKKLTNLQITVQDLKMKSVTKEGKSINEYESVKKLLEKAEKDIKELSDLNGNLTKSIDKSDDVKYEVETEERMNFSEQARKSSERIGQLEFEVQKIEYIMLKLGGENEKENIKKKSETNESKRTSFRNYLGLKSSSKTKKRAFCGFVEPSTTEN